MEQPQNPDTETPQIQQEELQISTTPLQEEQEERPDLYKKQYININENENPQQDNDLNARYRRVKRGEEDESQNNNVTEIPKNIDNNISNKNTNVKINTDFSENNNYANDSRLSTNNNTDKKNQNSNKMRNTISGVYKGNRKFDSELIDVILGIEKENVNHYLSNDLANMYKDITNDNQEFKEDIFLANVDNFDKKTGILGKKKFYKTPIYPYPSSTNDINKLLTTFNHTEDIIQKFSERSKKLNNENYA